MCLDSRELETSGLPTSGGPGPTVGRNCRKNPNRAMRRDLFSGSQPGVSALLRGDEGYLRLRFWMVLDHGPDIIINHHHIYIYIYIYCTYNIYIYIYCYKNNSWNDME